MKLLVGAKLEKTNLKSKLAIGAVAGICALVVGVAANAQVREVDPMTGQPIRSGNSQTSLPSTVNPASSQPSVNGNVPSSTASSSNPKTPSVDPAKQAQIDESIRKSQAETARIIAESERLSRQNRINLLNSQIYSMQSEIDQLIVKMNQSNALMERMASNGMARSSGFEQEQARYLSYQQQITSLRTQLASKQAELQSIP